MSIDDLNNLLDHPSSKRSTTWNSIPNDCIVFRPYYIKKIIGRILENSNISHNKKTVKDLFFIYGNLEEDKRVLHNTKSSDILAKRFDMLDFFFEEEERKEVYIDLYLESMLIPLSTDDLIEIKEKFYYDMFNCNIDIKKLLVNNINKWLSKR